jgi:hypothetical protein
MDSSYVDQKLGDAVQLLFRYGHSMDHDHPLPTDESYGIIGLGTNASTNTEKQIPSDPGPGLVHPFCAPYMQRHKIGGTA